MPRRKKEVIAEPEVKEEVKAEENKAYFYVSAEPGNSGFVLLWD